jgi:transposase-like protein
MSKFNKTLTKVVKDFLYYGKENAVEKIVQTVFETILYYEREDFLKTSKEKNKANGYYQRVAKSINKYFKLKVPRDRLSLFKPVFLEAIKSQESQMQDLAFSMYTKGLTTRDIQDIFKNIYQKKLSPSSVSNITKDFEQERKAWLNKEIENDYYFIYIDAIQSSVRRGNTVEKEAFYVVIGLRTDLKRDILGVYNIPQESLEGWREVIKDLKRRKLRKPLMVIADGIQYLEEVIKEELPGTKLQKCLFHKKKNILLKIRSSDKTEIVKDFNKVFVLEEKDYTIEKGKENLNWFLNKWKKSYPSIVQKFKEKEIEYYFTYLEFPHQIHRMIYTTNWIERLNKKIRRTEKIRNSFPNPESALNLICAILIEFEKKVYSYPVTSFKKVEDKLYSMLSLLHQTQ